MARYHEQHVTALSAMLKQYGGHELICVQDGTFNIPNSIIMPDYISALPDYLPKLWAWSEEFHSIINRRFISIDLDTVILSDIGYIFDNDLPFYIWNEAVKEAYNSSLFVLSVNHYNNVWNDLSPNKLLVAKSKARKWTGDQSWIEYVLGSNMPTFGKDTGVIRYRPSKHRLDKPKRAKALFFCGPYDPITEGDKSSWIKANYPIGNVSPQSLNLPINAGLSSN